MEANEKGCVYFFRHIGLTPVKIGYTTNESPISRFDHFKTYAPYGSEILGFIQTINAKELEGKLHLKYVGKRLLGEWFEITEDDVNNEINFHSNIEDIRERNEFQINFAKYIKGKNEQKQCIINNTNEVSKRDAFLKMLQSDLRLNISHVSILLGVSRKTLYQWKRKI